MEDLEVVTLTINDAEFRHWESIEFKWGIDSYSSVGFTAPFEPDRRAFRDTFRPFKFQAVNVKVDGTQLFAGRIVGVHPRVTPERKEVEVTAYASPGVLEDCCAPATALPLEFLDLKLYTIASTLVRPFGMRVYYRQEENEATFDKVKLDVDKTIQDLLVDLAKQRNLVLTNTTFGDLLFWRSVSPGKPVANLREGQPLPSIEASFSPQDYFSEITGYAKPKPRKGVDGAKWTEKNKWLPDVLRPHSFKLDDAERGDAPEATRAKLGRMFAAMASYTVEVATWRDPEGELWRPNTTVKLHAPGAMIYEPYEFLVREVTLRQDKERSTATLTLCMPGAFSGEVPDRLPWDE